MALRAAARIASTRRASTPQSVAVSSSVPARRMRPSSSVMTTRLSRSQIGSSGSPGRASTSTCVALPPSSGSRTSRRRARAALQTPAATTTWSATTSPGVVHCKSIPAPRQLDAGANLDACRSGQSADGVHEPPWIAVGLTRTNNPAGHLIRQRRRELARQVVCHHPRLRAVGGGLGRRTCSSERRVGSRSVTTNGPHAPRSPGRDSDRTIDAERPTRYGFERGHWTSRASVVVRLVKSVSSGNVGGYATERCRCHRVI